MYGWKYGCMDVWMHECMDVCMYVCMYVWNLYGWMYVCMYIYAYIKQINYTKTRYFVAFESLNAFDPFQDGVA